MIGGDYDMYNKHIYIYIFTCIYIYIYIYIYLTLYHVPKSMNYHGTIGGLVITRRAHCIYILYIIFV